MVEQGILANDKLNVSQLYDIALKETMLGSMTEIVCPFKGKHPEFFAFLSTVCYAEFSLGVIVTYFGKNK